MRADMKRWTMDEWIAYLMHPASVVLLKIDYGRVVVTSGEGTESMCAMRESWT